MKWLITSATCRSGDSCGLHVACLSRRECRLGCGSGSLPPREEGLIDAQAVALLQVGNGEIDVVIVDQQTAAAGCETRVSHRASGPSRWSAGPVELSTSQGSRESWTHRKLALADRRTPNLWPGTSEARVVGAASDGWPEGASWRCSLGGGSRVLVLWLGLGLVVLLAIDAGKVLLATVDGRG